MGRGKDEEAALDLLEHLAQMRGFVWEDEALLLDLRPDADPATRGVAPVLDRQSVAIAGVKKRRQKHGPLEKLMRSQPAESRSVSAERGRALAGLDEQHALAFYLVAVSPQAHSLKEADGEFREAFEMFEDASGFFPRPLGSRAAMDDDGELRESLQTLRDHLVGLGIERRVWSETRRASVARLQRAECSEDWQEQLLRVEGRVRLLRSSLIEQNVKLIASIAHRYSHRIGFRAAMLYGVWGFEEGLDRYDPTRGYQLSTYVSNWVRQKVQRVVANTGQPLRIPVYRQEHISQWLRLRAGVIAETQRVSSPDEVAIDAEDPGLAKVPRLLSPGLSTERLQGSGVPLRDVLVDPEHLPPARAGAVLKIQQLFLDALAEVEGGDDGERKRMILESRSGIGRPKHESLENLGQQEGVTRERIRQIESKALGHLWRAGANETQAIVDSEYAVEVTDE